MTVVALDRSELSTLASAVEGIAHEDVGSSVRAAGDAGTSGLGGSGLAGALSEIGGVAGSHADGFVRSLREWARAVQAGGEGFAAADRAASVMRPV